MSNNLPSIEIVLSNQELDSLDDPNSRVILVKTGDSSPSVLTSTGRGQTSNFSSHNLSLGSTGGRRTPHINAEKKQLVYRIKEDSGLVRAAEEACKNADVQKDANQLAEQLALGNENPGIGRKWICKNVVEHRGTNGGRIYAREADGVIEIVAKSGKKKNNQRFVINRVKKKYMANLILKLKEEI